VLKIGIILSFLLVLVGCQSTTQNKLSSNDTKLYKTWSNVYLVEMGNAIANHDFDTYAFYMSEYEQTLSEENKRTIQFLDAEENVTRYENGRIKLFRCLFLFSKIFGRITQQIFLQYGLQTYSKLCVVNMYI
jgi:hypothetical protein